MKNKTLTLIKHKLQWLALLVALLGVSQGVWGTNEISANDSRASGIFVTYTSGGTQYSNMGYRINDTADMWVGGCTPKMSNYKNKDFHDTNFGVVTELKITGGEVNWRLFGCGSGCNDYIEGRFSYKVWKTTDSEPNDYTNAFTVKTWECGNRWDGASDVSSLLQNQNIDLLSKCTSSGEYYVKVKMEVQARWTDDSFGNTLSYEAKARFTFEEISSNYSLGGYINNADITSYSSNQDCAFVSKGNGEYVLNRSFTEADNYFLIYDESGNCYGVSSYTEANPATLTKKVCDQKVGAKGLTRNQNYTITWNANTKQISWSSACTAPTVVTNSTASSITASGATVKGTITNGTCNVTASGIAYGTSTNPTSGTSVVYTSGTEFSVNLTGLTAGTTYYFRTYATANGTTTYGEEYSFTTLYKEPSAIYIKGPIRDNACWPNYNDTPLTKNGNTYSQTFSAYYNTDCQHGPKEFVLSTSTGDANKLNGNKTFNGAGTNGWEYSTRDGANTNFNCTLDYSTGEEITLKVIFNTSTGEYTMTMAKGCTTPTVPVIASYDGSVCSGGSPKFTTSTSESGVSYQLYTSADVASGNPVEGTGSAITITASAITNPTTFYIKATNSSTSCTSNSDNKVVTIQSNASIGSVKLSSSSVCIGDENIIATTENVVTGGGTGEWRSDDIDVATIDANGKITTVAAGTANITYTITNGCGGTVSKSATITVGSIPTAAQYPMTNNTVPFNGSAQAPTITPAADAGAYTLYYNGSTSADGVTNAGEYTVTADVTQGTAYCAKNGLELGIFTINKIPQGPSLVISNETKEFCYSKDQSVKLTTTGGEGDGAISYNVVSGSGKIDGSTLTASAAGSIVVTATKAEGTNHLSQTSEEVTFTFSPDPTSTGATGQLNAGEGSPWEGSKAASATGGYFADDHRKITLSTNQGGNLFYWECTSKPSNSTLTWENQGTEASPVNTSTSTVKVSLPGEYTFKCYAKCSTGSYIASNDVTVTVPYPEMGIEGPGVTGCQASNPCYANGAGKLILDDTGDYPTWSGSYTVNGENQQFVVIQRYKDAEVTFDCDGEKGWSACYEKCGCNSICGNTVNKDNGNNTLSGVTLVENNYVASFPSGTNVQIKVIMHSYNSYKVIVCTPPTVYELTDSSSGDICSGSLSLSGSQSGYSYQLYKEGFKYGDATPGTGSAISFDVHESGTYTCKAYYGSDEAACLTDMSGEVVRSITGTTPELVRSATTVTGYVPVTITSINIEIDSWSVEGEGSTAYFFDQTSNSIVFKASSERSPYTITATKGGCSNTTTITVVDDTETCGN